MARQTRAKLDKKGLSGLGLDKLVEILLEEATANKALKARLLTALAGETGPHEMARLLDKRLDTYDQAVTRINTARAKDLAIEFAGLSRNILSELGAADPAGAAERILRFLALRFPISARLVSDNARLWKVFDDTEVAAAELIGTIAPEEQVLLVPQIEKLRLRDRYGEHTGFLRTLTGVLGKPAAESWKALLNEVLAKEPLKLGALDLLQALAVHQGDLDTLLKLENSKPENRRDTLAMAALLHAAGRFQDALEWVQQRPSGLRLLPFNGELVSVGPEYGARERRLLEAEILERLKRREDAQALRWREFSETFDPAVLKLYLAKLDDFAEFDEIDRAFALVENASDIYAALEFFVTWPKLDRAAAHVLRHDDRWEGRYFEDLAPAAEALADQQPLAATVLYRTLISDILRRGIGIAYPFAARYLVELGRIAPHLPDDVRLKDHEDFVDDLRRNHPKKHGFWSAVPGIWP
ncbi:DUF6880 family protein [Rhizobium sp. CECT 9324]|uniref:DUF6880 family protein n=1 Tax=Rhizobium sp. CECT 9324 TaxID=2845820 RepID=UPI001E3C725F|nr:DUF6880 family protein [Rhizobium sp. CECT 9324]CAH0339650.1 hypothetical protein RHI9324_01301 [Rhizobium sp. CECT 9324]